MSLLSLLISFLSDFKKSEIISRSFETSRFEIEEFSFLFNKDKELLFLFVSSIVSIFEFEISKLLKKFFSFFEIEKTSLLFNKNKKLLSFFISSIFLIFESEVFKLSKKSFLSNRIIFNIIIKNNEE